MDSSQSQAANSQLITDNKNTPNNHDNADSNNVTNRKPFGYDKLWFSLGLGLVALVTFVLYLGTTRLYFVSDDFIFLNQLHFKYPNFADNLIYFGQDWGVGVKFYRPLSRLFWAAEYSFFDDNAANWHLVGIAVYAANAALVYLLAWTLTRRISLALLAGLFFGLHPTHTEPVSWIAAHTDLLVALFCLSGTIFYIRAKQALTNGSRRGIIVNYGLTMGCFGLAMLSKESAAGVFFIPLTYDLAFEVYSQARWRQPGWWLRLITRQLPFGLELALFLGLRVVVLGGIGGYATSPTDSSVPLNIIIEAYSKWLLSPFSLDRTVYRVGLAVLAIGLFGGLVVWEMRRSKVAPVHAESSTLPLGLSRTIVFTLGWIVVFLLPTLTTPPSLRFTYLSTAGVAILFATLLAPLGAFSLKAGQLFKGPGLIEKIQHSPLTSGLKLLFAAVILFWSAQQVWVHQDRWFQASQISHSILTDLHAKSPDLVNYSYIYAANLPPTNEEAFIFNTGFPEAVQILYNNPTIVGITTPSFPIIEQHLLQAYLVEYQYQSGQLVSRDDLLETFKQRNENIKDKKEQLLVAWKMNQSNEPTGWALLSGQGNLSQSATGLKLNLPEGGVLRPPLFQLAAPLLSNLELTLQATPINSGNAAAQIVVHWLVTTPGGNSERTSAALVIQADGKSHTYRIKPLDMSPFFYNENVSEIRLEFAPGLSSIEIEQAALYRLP